MPQPISRMRALAWRLREAADQRRKDLAPCAIPPVALVQLRHLIIDDPFHQRKTHCRLSAKVASGVTKIAGISGHQVGPCSGPVRTQVKASLSRKPELCDREELDLHRVVLALAVPAEAPAAVEHEADADGHQESDDDREHRRHDIGREVPVDRRIDDREREPDDAEANQLTQRLRDSTFNLVAMPRLLAV